MFSPVTRSRMLQLTASMCLMLTIAAPVSALTASSIALDMTNFTGDSMLGRATLEQVGNDVKVTLTTVQEGGFVNTGDWGGFWFNIADDSLLAGLNVSGADVTDFDFSGSVGWVGSANNNLNGGGSPGLMDAGIAFGDPGAQGGLLDMTMFTLSHANGLSLSLFEGQTMAGRIQTVGPAPFGGEGSSKIVTGDNPIPEPASATLALLGLSSLTFMRRRTC